RACTTAPVQATVAPAAPTSSGAASHRRGFHQLRSLQWGRDDPLFTTGGSLGAAGGTSRSSRAERPRCGGCGPSSRPGPGRLGTRQNRSTRSSFVPRPSDSPPSVAGRAFDVQVAAFVVHLGHGTPPVAPGAGAVDL